MTRFALPDPGRRWPGMILWFGSSIPQQATKYLEQIERRAIQARPLTNGRFIPLVFSSSTAKVRVVGSGMVHVEEWRESGPIRQIGVHTANES